MQQQQSKASHASSVAYRAPPSDPQATRRSLSAKSIERARQCITQTQQSVMSGLGKWQRSRLTCIVVPGELVLRPKRSLVVGGAAKPTTIPSAGLTERANTRKCFEHSHLPNPVVAKRDSVHRCEKTPVLQQGPKDHHKQQHYHERHERSREQRQKKAKKGFRGSKGRTVPASSRFTHAVSVSAIGFSTPAHAHRHTREKQSGSECH